MREKNKNIKFVKLSRNTTSAQLLMFVMISPISINIEINDD